MNPMKPSPCAIAVERTENSKTGLVSVTMASQASCPTECPMLHKGCYAETGFQGIFTARLNRSKETDAIAIAQAEAKAIRTLSGTRPLRLHVVGDCSTPRATAIVSRACNGYAMPVWTYTHAWRRVPRKIWRTISVLASCETTRAIREARQRGYATALVVPKFESDKAYTLDGIKVIPCPQQTGHSKDCTTCKLCWDDSRLKAIGATIGFQAHGVAHRKLADTLVLLQAGTK